MKSQLRFFGGISGAAGHQAAVEVEFNGRTLGELLDYIQARWPGTVDFISGPRAGSVILVLNQRSLARIDPDLPLKNGDKLAFMPFVAGG